ncbi:MAG: NADH-quinone oxidoreductase subunit M [Fimbriimonadales bacterium]|nr:NADH-quinone oxidoreductase subunit M [Fimbriimonadales bacterium]MDW8051628.1 NADH-quinone oxidoreductase subunit M [Armatimonadota bacterium]
MDWLGLVLSWTLWMPTIGAVLLMLVPKGQELVARAVALAVALITLGMAGVLIVGFDTTRVGYQFVEQLAWLPDYGVSYYLGVDAVSVWLVGLTALLSVLAVALAFSVHERVREFLIWMLVLETALLGVFMALDVILFYVFFELTLVPTYFLISQWGGRDRAAAALKFFLYTFFGSLLMLVATLVLAFEYQKEFGSLTFELPRLQAFVATRELPNNLEVWLFWGFVLAFAVKLPLVPFHTWWPHAMGVAPLPLLVVFLKTGAYGLMRYAIPLFPDAAQAFAPTLVAWGAIAVVYGAIVAIMQSELRRVVLYAIISHAGFIVMGLFSLTPEGFTGSVLQQLNHGITMGAMFLLLALLEARTRTLQIAELGGLKHQMPLFSAVFLITVLAAVALPGTNNFIGELLCLLGTYYSAHLRGYSVVWVVVGLAGTVLAVVYMLWMFQRVFYGATPARWRGLPDLRPLELLLVAPLLALIFAIGVRPVHWTKAIEPVALKWAEPYVAARSMPEQQVMR